MCIRLKSAVTNDLSGGMSLVAIDETVDVNDPKVSIFISSYLFAIHLPILTNNPNHFAHHSI